MFAHLHPVLMSMIRGQHATRERLFYEGKALYDRNNPPCTFHAIRRDIILILSESDRQEL